MEQACRRRHRSIKIYLYIITLNEIHDIHTIIFLFWKIVFSKANDLSHTHKKTKLKYYYGYGAATMHGVSQLFRP